MREEHFHLITEISAQTFTDSAKGIDFSHGEVLHRDLIWMGYVSVNESGMLRLTNRGIDVVEAMNYAVRMFARARQFMVDNSGRLRK